MKTPNQRLFISVHQCLLLSVVITEFFLLFAPFATANQCQQRANCYGLKNTTCLGVNLPYKQTSLGEFAGKHLRDEIEIKKFLAQWDVLQSVPRCWTSLQSFLCTLYLPKCDDGQVYLPSQEMCKTARNNCKFIERYFGNETIPSFLNCDQKYMPPNCGNGYQDLKLNTLPSKCKYPLTSTEDSNIWYPGFEGCAVQCESPLLGEKEEEKLSNFIKYGISISSFFLLICAINFLIEWKSANKYPSVIIFYSALCLLIHNFGWTLQFLLNKHDIVCRPDNTRRYGEPQHERTSESAACVLVFAFIYYPSMAAMIWIVILSFLWHRRFEKNNAFKDFVHSNGGYFHMVAWSVPFILLITIFSIGEIDSSPILGICYVGLDKVVVKIFMVFVPLIICSLCSLFFLILSVLDLRVYRTTIPKSDNARRMTSTINRMIYKIVAFAIYIFLAVFCTIFCTIYENNYYQVWEETLSKRIICSLDLLSTFAPAKVNECQSKIGINLFYTYLQLFIIFSSGIAVSLWSFTPKALRGWRRLVLKVCGLKPHRPTSRKHEIIAKGYHRRGELGPGNFSSFVQSIHGDPVGMGLTSATSQEISSEFVRVLPKFFCRRGGVTSLKDNHYLPDFSLNNNCSSTSDLYHSQYSMNLLMNKRGSFDSRLSNESEMAEMMMKHVKRKTKKERKKLFHGFSTIKRRDNASPNQSFVLASLKGKNGVTRATSTGDLVDQVSNQGSHHHMCTVMPTFPMSPLSYTAPSAFNYPVLPPQQQIVPRRCSQKLPSNHPFTHGMSQQGESLTNPLYEKRRPDSRINGPQSTSPVSVSRQQGNLGVGYLNALNYHVQPMLSPAQYNPYINGSMMSSCIANPFPQFLGIQAATPSMPSSVTPSIFSPFYCTPCRNLDELQKMAKEREKYLSLITRTETRESEDCPALPIQISDSEGFSDFGGIGDQVPKDVQATQKIVVEHMKRIEAKFEAESHKG